LNAICERTRLNHRSTILIFSTFLLMNCYAHGACFDPAISAGFAFKDQLTASLIVVQKGAGNSKQSALKKDTVVGIGVKGKYFGCTIVEPSMAGAIKEAKSARSKNFSIFARVTDVQSGQSKAQAIRGYEINLSIATRRVLSARAIQVPWDLVDRRKGATTVCGASSATAFEMFLYRALRQAKSRRCTQVEIENFVGSSG
jgi:hypothetical protein